MDSRQEFLNTSVKDIPVRGYLHHPAVAGAECLVLTHGAGANCDAPLLTGLANAFCTAGVTVLRCDLPFRQARPHGPPPRGSAEADQSGLRAAVEFMRCHFADRVFLGGHSYGGRQASMLAASEPGLVAQLLLLSYPLHPPRRPDELRTQHFPLLQTPALFIHGTRDVFGSVVEMEAAMKLIPGRNELLPIAGAGHDIINPRNRETLPQLVVEAFQSFTNYAAA